MTDPDPVDIHIGQRAASRRQSLGLAPGDVAQALGLDEAALHDLEAGLRGVAASQLWIWSNLLQVPIAWSFKVPAEAPGPLTRMIFVPNPDFDWPGDADPTAVH